MNRRTTERLRRLALGCFVFWSVGAALTHVIGIWAGMGGAAIGLGIAALVLARETLAPLLRPSRRRLVGGLAAAAVMIAVTYGLYPLMQRTWIPLSDSVLLMYGLLREVRLPWLPLLLLPFMIVSEELVWRGVVFEALRRQTFGRTGEFTGMDRMDRMNGSFDFEQASRSSILSILSIPVECRNIRTLSRLTAVVVLSAVAYAVAHAPIGSPLLVALALLCGLFWSALRAWTGSLVAPLVSHLLWDLLVFSLRPLA
jgi:membrane protease YdiL (CAAX protease family)